MIGRININVFFKVYSCYQPVKPPTTTVLRKFDFYSIFICYDMAY